MSQGYNPHRTPAGSPDGGKFAPGDAGKDEAGQVDDAFDGERITPEYLREGDTIMVDGFERTVVSIDSDHRSTSVELDDDEFVHFDNDEAIERVSTAADADAERDQRWNAYAVEFEEETGLRPDRPYTDTDTTFEEFGEFTPIADGPSERGKVGVFSATDTDGNNIEVTQQLAISQDENGRWWNIHRSTQTVTTPEGRRLFRELSVGNIDSQTYSDEDDAWRALADAEGSLSHEHQHSDGAFEVLDENWYEEV